MECERSNPFCPKDANKYRRTIQMGMIGGRRVRATAPHNCEMVLWYSMMHEQSEDGLRSAAVATAFVVGRYSARAADGYPFTLGVASGEPSQDGFVLWTRLAPVPLELDGLGGASKPVSVMWEVAGTVEAVSRLAHSVHVEVAGLEPGRPYWYRFTALGQQSPIGRAKTAPAPNAQPDSMRFSFASCSNWEVGFKSAAPQQ
jgi:alkaline phosphatase D